MSQFLIEVDDSAINDQVSAILNTVLNQELRSRYTDANTKNILIMQIMEEEE